MAGKLFGNAELRLIQKRLSAAMRHVWPGRGGSRPWELAIRLQGSADWDQVWEDLTGVADRLNLQTIGLDVNAPAMHENYHARWDRPAGPSEAFLWRLEIPLLVTGIPIGRMSVSAERVDQSIADALEVLVKMVEMAEIRAADIAMMPKPVTPSKPVIAKPSVPASV